MSVAHRVQRLSSVQKSSAPVQNAVQEKEGGSSNPVAAVAATQMQTRAAYGSLSLVQRLAIPDEDEEGGGGGGGGRRGGGGCRC